MYREVRGEDTAVDTRIVAQMWSEMVAETSGCWQEGGMLAAVTRCMQLH